MVTEECEGAVLSQRPAPVPMLPKMLPGGLGRGSSVCVERPCLLLLHHQGPPSPREHQSKASQLGPSAQPELRGPQEPGCRGRAPRAPSQALSSVVGSETLSAGPGSTEISSDNVCR